AAVGGVGENGTEGSMGGGLETERLVMVTAVKRPAGETRGKVAAGPDARQNATAPAPDPTDQHDVPAGQLAVGGDEQVAVLDPAERLRLVLAPAVEVQPADQPGAIAGPVTGQPGHRHRPRCRLPGRGSPG